MNVEPNSALLLEFFKNTNSSNANRESTRLCMKEKTTNTTHTTNTTLDSLYG